MSRFKVGDIVRIKDSFKDSFPFSYKLGPFVINYISPSQKYVDVTTLLRFSKRKIRNLTAEAMELDKDYRLNQLIDEVLKET